MRNQKNFRLHWLIWVILILAVPGLFAPFIWKQFNRPDRPVASLPTAEYQGPNQALRVPQANTQAAPAEQPLTLIPMTGRLAEPEAEISGLAWYGDYLVLLPQYPRRVTGGEEGFIYALRRSDIEAYLDGKTDQPLDPIVVPFDAYKLRSQMNNFQGFESIGFLGDKVYVIIESGGPGGMMGYLFEGKVEGNLARIVMDSSKLAAIEPQTSLANKADEALLVLDDRVLTFYEVNGAAFNPHPVVHKFSLNLESLGRLPSPSLEYRLTDAARVPGTNEFWVINSFFLADIEILPKSDPLAEKFGKGPTHSRLPMVERLVQMQFDPVNGVSLTDQAPVQLELEPFETRNWEGLAILEGRGFLLATDKYPATLLAFVPFP